MDQPIKRASLDKTQILIAFLGMAFSLYAFYIHLKSKLHPSTALSCDINDALSCSKVLNSDYSEFFSIPLGAYGLAFFGIVMALALLPYIVRVNATWIWQWRLLASVKGAAVALLLMYISYFEVGVICPSCSVVHVLCFIEFILCLFMWSRARKSEPVSVAEEGAFLKLVSLSLALSVPALLAGLLLPLILPGIVGVAAPSSNKVATAESVAAPAAVQLPLSRSNMVGDGEDYRKGNDNAQVVIHKFADYECPHCAVAAQALDTAVATVGKDKVLYVFRNYPLSSRCNPKVQHEGHKYACDLAVASRCAGLYGKFWEMHDFIFENIQADSKLKSKLFSQDGLTAQARKIGVDEKKFLTCMQKPNAELKKIKADAAAGDSAGLDGTPLILINGKRFQGNPTSSQELIAAISAELH